MGGKRSKGDQRRALAALSERAPQRGEQVVRLVDERRYAEAELRARQFLQQTPGDLSVKKALSAALLYQDKRDEARELCRDLVDQLPKDWECWANLAFIERELEDWPSAFEAYNKALELNPKMDSLCFELAKLYRATNQNHLALRWFFEALKNKPDNRQYFLEWVTTLQHLRKHSEALQCLRGAWADERGDPELAVHLIPVATSLAEWGLLEEAISTFRQRLADGHADDLPPLSLLSLPDFDRRTLVDFTQKRIIGGLQAFKAMSEIRLRSLDPDRRLRIGYLSADIFDHATTYLVNGVLLAHEEVGLDLCIYSYGPDDKGDRRKELMEKATVFRDVQMSSAEQAAKLIDEDEIDILVDLKGWTKDYRADIQALRPAPVIVSWLGFPGSLGHTHLADYIIGDPVVTPLEHADGYTECIAQMPHCYQPNDNRRALPTSKSRSEVGLPEDAFVFCSFNRVDKLTSIMFDAWCRILLAVPESILWLLSDFPQAQENLRRHAAAMGVAPERIVFAPTVKREEHQARLQCADLALDSFPYTAHTTGSDALWAGVPLVALRGETFISRVSSSIVTAAGMPELIASDLSQFEAMAIRLARSPAALKDLRRRLHEGRMQCPLFDTQKFARDLARLYREIWKNHIRGVRRPVLIAPE